MTICGNRNPRLGKPKLPGGGISGVSRITNYPKFILEQPFLFSQNSMAQEPRKGSAERFISDPHGTRWSSCGWSTRFQDGRFEMAPRPGGWRLGLGGHLCLFTCSLRLPSQLQEETSHPCNGKTPNSDAFCTLLVKIETGQSRFQGQRNRLYLLLEDYQRISNHS